MMSDAVLRFRALRSSSDGGGDGDREEEEVELLLLESEFCGKRVVRSVDRRVGTCEPDKTCVERRWWRYLVVRFLSD